MVRPTLVGVRGAAIYEAPVEQILLLKHPGASWMARRHGPREAQRDAEDCREQGLMCAPRPPTMYRRGSARPANYGKPRLSVRSIAAKLRRTPNQVMLKAPSEFDVAAEIPAVLGSEPVFSDRQQAEGRRRLAAQTRPRSAAVGMTLLATAR